jgi:hypothetical protein
MALANVHEGMQQNISLAEIVLLLAIRGAF